MDKLKQTLLYGAVAFLAVIAGGWFLLVAPQRSSVASLAAQKTSVDQGNQSLQLKIAQLKSEAVDATADEAQLAEIARRLPPDLSEATLLRDLFHAAAAANVDLQVVQPGQPVLDATAAPAPAVTVAATTTAAAGTTTAAATLAATPASTNQLYSIPVAITIVGPYFNIEMFVHSLEGMQRAMLVDALSLTKANTAVVAAPASGAAATTTAATALGGTSKVVAGAKGKTSSGTKHSSAKPVAGSPEAAQAADNAANPFVPDPNDLAATLTTNVFSMYTPVSAASFALPSTATATATATPSPTK